jgi:HD-like signal output (HDOD) protein
MKTRKDLSANEIEALHVSLQKRLGDTSVPTLPQVAVRIIELVSDPNSTIAAFTEAIRTDQALTGRLLRMSNSAAFGQRQPVTKIERAMVLMGLDRIKALTLGFHLSQVATGDSGEFSFQRIWTQSVFRGWLALRLAERFNKSVSGEAFIVALLADCGLPMMPKLIGSAYGNTVRPGDAPAAQYMAEWNALPFTHADVAGALGRMWKLPPMLARPIMNHHSKPGPMNPADGESVLMNIAYFVGMIPLDPAGKAVTNQAIGRQAELMFQITPEELPDLFALAAKDFEGCKAVFAHILDRSLSVDAIMEQASTHLIDKACPHAEADHAAPAAGKRQLRLTAGPFSLMVEPADAGHVQVRIADAKGAPLLTERVHPGAQSENEIRTLLLLDGATPAEFAEVMRSLRSLAA